MAIVSRDWGDWRDFRDTLAPLYGPFLVGGGASDGGNSRIQILRKRTGS